MGCSPSSSGKKEYTLLPVKEEKALLPVKEEKALLPAKENYTITKHEKKLTTTDPSPFFEELYYRKGQWSIYDFACHCYPKRMSDLFTLSDEELRRIISIFTEIKDEFRNFSMIVLLSDNHARRIFIPLEPGSDAPNVKSLSQYFKYRDDLRFINHELKSIGNSIALFKRLKRRINAMDDADKIWEKIILIMFLALERKPLLEKRMEFLKKEIDRYENDFEKIREMVNPPLPPKEEEDVF